MDQGAWGPLRWSVVLFLDLSSSDEGVCCINNLFFVAFGSFWYLSLFFDFKSYQYVD